MRYKITIQRSIAGFWICGLFMTAAFAAYVMHKYSVKHNAGDSGESAIMLVPFCLPWIFIINGRVGEFILLSIPCNAFILYLLCGGLKIKDTGGK